MNNKQHISRSLDEWMALVTECRKSGLSDVAWCHENGISPSSFYNAVSRLRKKACKIPEPSGKRNTLDLTSHKQDVIQVGIEPETTQAEIIPMTDNTFSYLDNSHTIEIESNGLTIHINNDVQPVLLKALLDALRTPIC